MKVRITTNECDQSYDAATVQNAIRLFFADILNERVPKKNLGFVGIAHGKSEGDDVYFRIASALCNAGWFSFEDVQAMAQAVDLSFTLEEIKQMSQADAWMLELPDEWPETIDA